MLGAANVPAMTRAVASLQRPIQNLRSSVIVVAVVLVNKIERSRGKDLSSEQVSGIDCALLVLRQILSVKTI